MFQLLTILAVIAAVLLILIVLVQESKGGGLASDFAGGNAVMGVRKTTDVVEKATWTLAVLLVLFSVATSFVSIPKEADSTQVVLDTKAPAPVAPVQAPVAGAPATDAPAE